MSALIKAAILGGILLVEFGGSALAADPPIPAVNANATNCANGAPLAYSASAWQCNAATTVGSLPTCNSALEGAEYVVTNALLPAALAAVAAGGAVHVKVTCLNSSWIVQ